MKAWNGDCKRRTRLSALRPDAVVRFFLADLIGLTALKRLRLLLTRSSANVGTRSGARQSHLLGIVAAQAGLLGAAIYYFGGYRGIPCYIVFWLVPLVTVYPFIIRLRTVTEHYSDELHHSAGGAFVSRTSLTGWLERYLLDR